MTIKVVRDGVRVRPCPQCGGSDVSAKTVRDHDGHGPLNRPGFECLTCGCQWFVEGESGGAHAVPVKE